ncbi:hypothetical protein [Lysobacter terrae]
MNVRAACLVLVCLCAAGAATAGEKLRLVDASFMDLDAQLTSARGRPNEEWRLNGLKAYQGDHYDEAVRDFERAASYADKYSQHFLSLIHWHGVGVPVDRVQAYVWSDLAAERGSHPLLAIREKMWQQLTAEERAHVLELGPSFYDRYGDAVAKPRAEMEMRRFARSMTGSRVGYRSQMMESGGGPVNGSLVVETGTNAAAYAVSVAGSPDELYGEEGGLKRLQVYWQSQDALLERAAGRVDIGPATRDRRP